VSDAVADLYVSLRAETAPLTAGFGEAAAAGEEMTAALTAASAEAAGGFETVAAASVSMSEEVQAAVLAAVGVYIDATGRMFTIDGELIDANSMLAKSAQELALGYEKAAGDSAAAMSVMRDKVLSDVAEMEAAETRLVAANELAAAKWSGSAIEMGTVATAANTFKTTLSDTAGMVGLTSGQLMGLGAAAGIVAGVTVKMAGDFDMATTRLVTSANETEGNLDMVRDGILKMAGQVGYSADDLAKAMYKIESGGQHGADGLKVLQAAAEGAKAENADLTTVSDAVTTALIDYHLKADDAATVTSKFVAATASGKMSFEELSGALSSVAPLASAANISLDDMLGTLASMTSHGISADQATQNMADAIRHLQAPTATQRQEMALLGISADDVSAKLGQRGLSGTMQYLQQAVSKAMPPGTDQVVAQLKTAVQNSTPAVQQLAAKLEDGSISLAAFTKQAKALDPISAKQAQSFATLAGQTHQLGTTNMDGATALQTYGGAMTKVMGDATGLKVALMTTGENADYTNQAIKNVSGATTEAGGHVRGWADIQNEFNTKLSQAKDSLGALAIQIGEKLLPVVSGIIGAFSTATTWLTQHSTVATIAAVVIGVVLVAAFVALGIAAATAAVGVIAATWPILAIIAAVALLAYGIYELVQHWQGVADFFSGLWDKVKSAFTTAVNWCGDRISDLVGFVKSIPEKIGAALSAAGDAVKTALSKVGDFLLAPFRAGVDLVKTIMSKSPAEWGQILGQKLGELARTIADKAKELWEGFKQKFQEGWQMEVAFIKSIPQRIKDFFSDAKNWIADKAKALWEGFKEKFQEGWQMEVAFIKSIPQRVKDFFTDAKNWIADKAKEMWDGWIESGKRQWQIEVDFFTSLPSKIGHFFSDAGSWLLDAGKNILQGLWNGITGFFSTIWDGITSFISNFIDGFKRGLGIASPSTIFHSIGGDVVQGLWNGIKVQWEQFTGFLSELPGKIKDFFASAGDWLVNAGHDLLAGLWNGISSMTGWVWDKLTGWASSLWGGVKSALGISSPSKIAHESGMWLMQGLANGIDAAAPLAVTAAQAAANQIIAATRSTSGALSGLSLTASTIGSDGAALAATPNLLAGRPGILAGAPTGQQITVVNVQPTVQGNVWTTKDLVTELQQELLKHGIRNTGSGTTYGFGTGR
jgi:TP901 family phage tail tape measure protein